MYRFFKCQCTNVIILSTVVDENEVNNIVDGIRKKEKFSLKNTILVFAPDVEIKTVSAHEFKHTKPAEIDKAVCVGCGMSRAKVRTGDYECPCTFHKGKTRQELITLFNAMLDHYDHAPIVEDPAAGPDQDQGIHYA